MPRQKGKNHGRLRPRTPHNHAGKLLGGAAHGVGGVLQGRGPSSPAQDLLSEGQVVVAGDDNRGAAVATGHHPGAAQMVGRQVLGAGQRPPAGSVFGHQLSPSIVDVDRHRPARTPDHLHDPLALPVVIVDGIVIGLQGVERHHPVLSVVFEAVAPPPVSGQTPRCIVGHRQVACIHPVQPVGRGIEHAEGLRRQGLAGQVVASPRHRPVAVAVGGPL